MQSIYENGGIIGKTLDFSAGDSGIWALNSVYDSLYVPIVLYDNFTTDTSSSYPYADSTFLYSVTGGSFTYDGTNDTLDFTTGDNLARAVSRDLDTTVSSGYFETVIRKTADYPLDNVFAFRLLDSTGNNFYEVRITGSNYTDGALRKYVNNSIVNTTSLNHTLDDQASDHTYKIVFNTNSVLFYVDGSLNTTLTTTNTTEIKVEQVLLGFFQMNGYINSIEVGM